MSMEWFRSLIIRKLGGFTDVDDALESISDSKEKYRILTLTVKRLFNTIGPEDILKVHDTGQWMFQGKPLNDAQKNLLIAEATQFLESKLWDILQNDIKYQSNRKMFLLSQKNEDLIAGKLWLLFLDVFKTRLQSMKQGSASFNNK